MASVQFAERNGSSVSLSSAESVNKAAVYRTESNVSLESMGTESTPNFRLHAKRLVNGKPKRMSLWHDCPLFQIDEQGRPTGAVNFICEIPRFTRKKFEISTDEDGNPIKQDVKKGVLREFKKGDIFFNYGALPRTWEDPEYVHPDAGAGGDNDPLDVCEIGMRIVPTGVVRPVKVLGVLCLIDDGEADWKLITIDVEDRWAPDLNDIDDVERLLPGTVHAIREWFRTYKMADGKPENKFGLGGKAMGAKYAWEIIHETHDSWKSLVQGRKASSNFSSVRNLSYKNLAEIDITTDDAALAADVVRSHAKEHTRNNSDDMDESHQLVMEEVDGVEIAMPPPPPPSDSPPSGNRDSNGENGDYPEDLML